MAFVTLDIAGHVVKTKISTLTSVRGSYFDELFRETDGDFSGLLDKAGNLFFDRDYDTFSVVLGYLRDGASYPLPDNEYQLKKLRHEAVFLRLPGLVALIDRKVDPGSSCSALHDDPNAYDMADCGCDRSCLQRSPPPRPMNPKPILKSKLRSETRRRTTSVKPKGNVDFDGREGSDLTEDDISEKSDIFPLISLPQKAPSKKSMQLLPSCIRPQSVAISNPDNFTHVVHIGWQDHVKRMIVDSHVLSSEPTVREILKAAEDPDKLQQPVYSMIDKGDDSVEVFFSGQSMKQRANKAKKHVSVTAI
ncbi:hypothetical protein QR680_011884 [Steinernema hermaphroditum]|uniref:CRIB domain-containing protein n=1 Tax=Steinernema hermaphroditum TaxID=289476 RepID=A0AA39I023_9BILA|nr:hypothetical protein QR680_011884 [Steinernema hermaphroditum]